MRYCCVLILVLGSCGDSQLASYRAGDGEAGLDRGAVDQSAATDRGPVLFGMRYVEHFDGPLDDNTDIASHDNLVQQGSTISVADPSVGGGIDGSASDVLVLVDGESQPCSGSSCPTVDSDARIGSGSLNFDGANDFVSLGNVDVPGDAMTISMWVKPTSLGAGDARLLSKATGLNNEDHLWMLSAIDSTDVRFRLRTQGVTTMIRGTNDGLTFGTWHHVAAVYDGSQMRLYLDGALVASAAKTGAIAQDSSVEARLGQNPDGYGSYGGLIDDAAVLSRAMSETEIATIAQSGGPLAHVSSQVLTLDRTVYGVQSVLVGGTGATTVELSADGQSYYAVDSNGLVQAEAFAAAMHQGVGSIAYRIYFHEQATVDAIRLEFETVRPQPVKVDLSGPSTLAEGSCGTYRVQALDANDRATAVTADTPITLVGGATGSFYSDSDCTVQTTGTSIAADTAEATVYYRSTQTGSLTLEASSTTLGSDTLDVTIFAGNTSPLWGNAGELWDPRGRLPDFSYAGYRAGEEPPTVPVVTNVLDFGAVGDGVTDNSAAFQAAIAATHNGALLVPAGVYRISANLNLDRSNIVLRGEGATDSGTVLKFDQATHGCDDGGNTGNCYGASKLRLGKEMSFGEPTILATVSPALRGDHWITLSDASAFSVGDYIVIVQQEDDVDSMARHLMNDQGSPASGYNFKTLYWPVRISEINGNQVRLFQPLRFDIRPEWQPGVRIENAIREVGVENLLIDLPDLQHPSHFGSNSYNGVDVRRVINGWIRNVTVRDADLPVWVQESKHITLRVQIPPRTAGGSWAGHHGISFRTGVDCLLEDFDIDTRFHHDITIYAHSNGTVVRNGRCDNCNIDFHTRIPFANLVTNVDFGQGSRPYQSSGPSSQYPHSGAREVFWGNFTSGSEHLPPLSSNWAALQTTIVSCSQEQGTSNDIGQQWFETVTHLVPKDLYQSQRQRRLSGP